MPCDSCFDDCSECPIHESRLDIPGSIVDYDMEEEKRYADSSLFFSPSFGVLGNL